MFVTIMIFLTFVSTMILNVLIYRESKIARKEEVKKLQDRMEKELKAKEEDNKK